MKIVTRAILLLLAVFSVFTCVSCTKREIQTGIVEEGYTPNVSGRVRMSAYVGSSDIENAAVRAFARAFEAKYPEAHVDVDISIVGQDATATRIASGDIGDVFFFWEEDTYKYAVANNAIMNLTQYIAPLGIDLGNIYSGTLDLGRVNGKIYMVARDHTHVAMTYNRDALRSAGLEDPSEDWTWEEFKDYCEKLTIIGDDGYYDQIGAYIDYQYGPCFIPLLQGWGGVWVDTINKKVDLTSENVTKGVGEVIDLMSLGYILPIGATGEFMKSFSRVSGSIISCVFNTSVFPDFASRGKSYETYGVDWDACSFFSYPTHAVGAGATGYGVYNRTTNPDTAAALALFFYTEEGQIAHNGQTGGSVPNVRSLALDDFWRVGSTPDKNYDAYVSFPDCDVVGKFECRMPPEVAAIVRNGVASIFSNHFSGKANYTDTMAKLETQANEKWRTLYGG